MSESNNGERSNVIPGPWKKKPVDPVDKENQEKVEREFPEQVLSDTADLVILGWMGLEDDFMIILRKALKSHPLKDKIQKEISRLENVDKQSLVEFANNTHNHFSFGTNPALVVAIYTKLLQLK